MDSTEDRIPLWRGRADRPGSSVVAHALVSPEDFEQLSQHRWTLSSGGYAVRYVKREGKTICISMHREVLLLDGSPLWGDHVNGDKLDNRRCNLSAVTPAQNARNRRSDRSLPTNVTPRWDGAGYEARVSLGTFDTPEEAAEAVAEFEAWRRRQEIRAVA